MRRTQQARRELIKDLILIGIGVCIAFALVTTGVLDTIVGILGNGAFSSFIAGIFFTSAFTIAPASLALAHISLETPVHIVALWGALGALCGDLILFFFIRDKFTDDLKRSFKPSFAKHIMSSFHFGFLKWLSPILGAVIIASPLPDEFGLALMGASKMRIAVFVPLAFCMNFIGIYGLVWFAHMI